MIGIALFFISTLLGSLLLAIGAFNSTVQKLTALGKFEPISKTFTIVVAILGTFPGLYFGTRIGEKFVQSMGSGLGNEAFFFAYSIGAAIGNFALVFLFVLGAALLNSFLRRVVGGNAT